MPSGIAVVALHQRVAAHAHFALLAEGSASPGQNHRAALRAHSRQSPRRRDLDLGLRHGAAHGVHADFDRVAGVAHGHHRRGFGLPVGDDQLAAVHLVEHALHQLHRAGRAAHHAGAQAGEVVARKVVKPELRHVHGRNAVDAGGALVVHGLQRGPRVEGPVGQNDGRAGVHRAHGADDAAVAVEQRHRNHDLVLLGVVKSLRQKLPVVDHVVVGEHHALGQAGGAAGVLDVGHVVDGDVIGQAALGVEQRRPLGRVEIDGVLERQVEPVARAAQDLLVVGVLVLVPQEERLHARARERELQLVRAVGGIHVDQRRSGARAAHVHHDPLDAVGGPQAHAVAAADAERPQSARHAVGLGAQLGPGEPSAPGGAKPRPGGPGSDRRCGAAGRRWSVPAAAWPGRAHSSGFESARQLFMEIAGILSASFLAMNGSVRRHPADPCDQNHTKRLGHAEDRQTVSEGTRISVSSIL